MDMQWASVADKGQGKPRSEASWPSCKCQKMDHTGHDRQAILADWHCGPDAALAWSGSALVPDTTGAALDPATIGAALDPGTTGAALDPATTGSALDPATTGAALVPAGPVSENATSCLRAPSYTGPALGPRSTPTPRCGSVEAVPLVQLAQPLWRSQVPLPQVQQSGMK